MKVQITSNKKIYSTTYNPLLFFFHKLNKLMPGIQWHIILKYTTIIINKFIVRNKLKDIKISPISAN